MSRWPAERVARVLGVAPPPTAATFRRVWTDTRTIASGDLFVALTGERFDGHDFLESARAAGATGAVVRQDTAPGEGLVLFPVADPLAALGRLARARRDEIAGPVVAITGTNGKTATKELTAAALGTGRRVHATRANLNNEVGVPLTILAAPDDAEALVVEAGASEPGEIARLRDIIAPTVAVVTNVSGGHLEGFGSLARVMDEKVSLLDGVPTAVVGTDPPALAERARAVADRVLVAGLEPPADLRPDAWSLDAQGRVRLAIAGTEVTLGLRGRHQGENAMLALAAAGAAGVDRTAAARALAGVTVPGGRSEVIEGGGLVVLHDAYNANPASLAAALETAEAMRAGRPLVVLVGTMLELGVQSAAEHRRLAARIVEHEPTLVGAVGAFAEAFEAYRRSLGDALVTAPDADRLGREVAARLAGNEFVLLKASRGVRLERALAHLLPDREVPCSSTS